MEKLVIRVGEKVRCISCFDGNDRIKEHGGDYPVEGAIYTVKEINYSFVTESYGLKFEEINAGANEIGYCADSFESLLQWVEDVLNKIIVDVEEDFQM